ncbi:hypothetical protein KCP74_00250 [Salmonella enterica subsp. enterica]|nr:hypothetical protein KCP74_00250 [Salmonella enterica subsp. enterica]
MLWAAISQPPSEGDILLDNNQPLASWSGRLRKVALSASTIATGGRNDGARAGGGALHRGGAGRFGVRTGKKEVDEAITLVKQNAGASSQ